MATEQATDVSVSDTVQKDETIQALHQLTDQLQEMTKAVEALLDKNLGTVGWEQVEETAERLGIW